MIKSLILAGLIAFPVANWDTSQFTDEEAAVRKQFFNKSGNIPYTSSDGIVDPIGVHIPCCGIADAYEADELESKDGDIIAILTCNDPRNCVDIPGKIERAPGTKVEIPAMKILIPGLPVNNTGHGWVFLGVADGHVICYSRPPGT